MRASEPIQSLPITSTDLPPNDPGGQSPVVMYLKHSMMVVLPQPFWPKMRVNGEGPWWWTKSIFWGPGSCSSAEKLRKPWIWSFSILAIAKSQMTVFPFPGIWKLRREVSSLRWGREKNSYVHVLKKILADQKIGCYSPIPQSWRNLKSYCVLLNKIFLFNFTLV